MRSAKPRPGGTPPLGRDSRFLDGAGKRKRHGSEWLAGVSAVVLLSLASCSDEPRASDEAEPASGSSQHVPGVGAAEGDAILIKTALRATEQSGRGVVQRGSLLGDEDFCPGGTFTDRIARPEIGMVKSMRCRDGTLDIGFNPDPSTRVQNSTWRVLKGTERYAGMQGQGWMVVEFETDNASNGRETYTGVVTSGQRR